jgi:outer membrane receptor protein involved in Fe transport
MATLTTMSPAVLAADRDGSADDGKVIDEVFVTAQKREERLQDVPISISVLEGDVLDRSVLGVRDALASSPGIATIDTGSGTTQLTVRGVTGPGINQGSSTVGYYLDSAPFAMIRNSPVPDSNAYDLDRVEVLRGPQGTLYGASSANGVVRVLTKDANLDQFEMKARATGSSTKDGGENFRGDMAVNVPIVEGKVAARAVVGYEDWSGWIDRPFRKDANETEVRNLRLKVNAQPTEALSVGLSAWSSRSDFDGRPAANDQRTYRSSVEEPAEVDYDVYGLKVGYDFSAVSFTSATSYLEYSNPATLDYEAIFGPALANTVLHTGFDSKVFSQEFTFNSTSDGPWRWTAGAMYRDAKDKFFQWRRQYANPNGNRFYDTSESVAVFGELTRKLVDDRLELTGGLRYFEDTVETTETSRLSDPNATLVSAEDKFDAVTPRAVLTWHWSDAVMTYASYAEGFRSGFSQQPVVLFSAPDLPPVDADNLVNYEIGSKGTLWDNRLSFDVAVFYIDWQDIQQLLSIQATSGTGVVFNVSAGVNGESASGVGAEFGLNFRPTDGLNLGANFGWNDLTMDADVFSGTTQVFRKGDRITNSPEYTAGVSADYTFPMGSGGYEGVFATSANYVSLRELRALVAGQNTVLEGDNIVTARVNLGVNSPDGWSASLFVENLTDEDGTPIPTLDAVGQIRLRPRTIGLQVEYHY